MARFSSDDSVTRYVLPVLWITGRLVTCRGGRMQPPPRVVTDQSVGANTRRYALFRNIIIVVYDGTKLRTGGEVCCKSSKGKGRILI